MKSNPMILFAGFLILLFSQFAIGQENLTELYYSGNYDKTIEIATRSIATGDTAFSTFYMKALSEVQLGLTGAAIHSLQSGMEYHPENVKLKKMLAGQYFEAGDFKKARDSYTHLVQIDSTDVSSWLKLAEIASFRQQYGIAIDALEQVLCIDSLNLSSLMMLGDILNRQNNSEAFTFYKRAYKYYPDNQKAAYALGNWYIKAERADEAVRVCEKMLEVDSTNITFHKLLGYAHYKKGDPSPAVLHLKNAVILGDSTAFTFKFMGINQYLKVDFPGSIESLSMALGKDTTDAEVRFFLGASMAHTLAKQEALYHLDRSLELMKPDPKVVSKIYSEQGNIKRLQEEYEQAYSLYEKAWESDTTNPMALYFMASIMDNSLHRSEEALADYQRLIDQLDLMPDSGKRNGQIPTIRAIVEDRIISLKEELFFLDR